MLRTNKTLVAVLGALLLSVSSTVFATPTLIGTTTDPTGINGLVVDGVTYDLSFGNTPDSTPFSYQTTAALDAVSSLATALNSLGVTGLEGVNFTSLACAFSCVGALYVDAPVGTLADAAKLENFLVSTSWTNAGGFPTCVVGTTNCGVTIGEFVTWTRPSTVPEPSTFALLALGLASLVMLRRRLAR